MKTKYIKVSTADRLPEKTEWFYTEKGLMYWVYDKQSWEDIDGNDDTVGIDFYFEEVPDHEEEMREMLEWCRNYIIEEAKAVVPDLENLLIKIKQQS